MKRLVEVLGYMQRTINAPKNQYNSFGKYKYRNCEDILAGIKGSMPDGYSVYVTDEVIQVGDRFYMKATAFFSDGEYTLQAAAFAREADDKKGMDPAQLSGSTSSYARKYALCGLFAIDDSKLDAHEDMDAHHSAEPKASPSHKSMPHVMSKQENEAALADIARTIKSQTVAHEVLESYRALVAKYPANQEYIRQMSREHTDHINAKLLKDPMLVVALTPHP